MKALKSILLISINILSIFAIDANAWQLEVLTNEKIAINAASESNYAGIFLCLDKSRPDLVLAGNPTMTFGDDCVLAADPTFVSSDLFLQANDDIILEFDKNSNGESAKLQVQNGSGKVVYQLEDDGIATQTGLQSVITLKSTNSANGSVLALNNETVGLFNYLGAINFNNSSSTPGQIAYSNINTMDFKVNNVSPLMQLSNGTNHILMSNGAKLTSGGMWMDVSSRDKKNLENQVNNQNILTALTHLPIYQWRYKAEPQSLHMGPTAEDFRALFKLGPDSESLSPSDLAAVSLSAIQALSAENNMLEEEIRGLKEEIAIIKKEIMAPAKSKKKQKTKN